MNEELRRAIVAAYNQLPEDIRFSPATELELADFERTYGPIPPEFRWFLITCGGGAIGAEWVDGIVQLGETHKKFRAECELPEDQAWRMQNVFIIGWDGWGNPYGICQKTGRLLVEDHDFGGIYEMAASFSAFLQKGLPLSNGDFA